MKIQINLEGDEEKLKRSARFLEGALLELIHSTAQDGVERRTITPLIATKIKEKTTEYFLEGYNITDFDKQGEILHRKYISIEEIVRGNQEFLIT